MSSNTTAMDELFHKSTVCSTKFRTTFDWALEDYLSLKSYYAKDVASPQFNLNGTDKTCRLWTFHDISVKAIMVYVRFPCDVDYHTVKIQVSIINKSCKAVKSKEELITAPIPTVDRAKQFKDFPFTMMNLLDLPTTKGCLTNDTLTFRCQITVFKKILHTKLDTVHKEPYWPSNASRKLVEFFKEKTLSDVVVSVGDTDFHAHKVILAANSPTFEAMFKTEMTENLENKVTITDIEPAAFEAFLKCLYAESIDGMHEHIGNMLIIADRYDVRNLKEMCKKSITSCLNRENVVEYILLAHEYGFEDLKKEALSVAIEHKEDLSDSEDFAKLCSFPDLVAQVYCNVAE